VDDVDLDGDVLVDEVGRVSAVGEDATDLCGSEHHVFGARLIVEGFDGALVDEVELGVGAGDDVGVAAGLQCAHDGRAG